MVSGVNGETGSHAHRRVGLEHSNVCAPAPDLAQLLAGRIVLVQVVKLNHAKQGFVQVKKNLF